MRFLLLILIFASAVSFAETNRHLIVLDVDRVLLKEKDSIPAEGAEMLLLDGKAYRLSLLAPEFLVALTQYFAQKLNFPFDLAIFSGGTQRRNEGLVDELYLLPNLRLADWIDRTKIKSVDDLKPLQTVPTGLSRHEFIDRITSQGGQDAVPFFDFFSKDLKDFGFDLNRTILVDDNKNATPVDQRGHVLLIARPDTVGDDLSWAKVGRRSPHQIARARYRLARALGILKFAVLAVQSRTFETLPEALLEMQWDQRGRYTEEEMNSKEIYYEGMKILRWAYYAYLLPRHPIRVRSASDFKIKPIIPKAQDCEDYLSFPVGVYPWTD